MRAANGTQVPLLAMVDVDVSPAATSIQRLNRQTMLRIEAGIAQGVPMDEARAAVEAALDRIEFPPGYGYTFSGMGFNINSTAWLVRDHDRAGADAGDHGGGVRVAAVPDRDHVLRGVLDLRRYWLF